MTYETTEVMSGTEIDSVSNEVAQDALMESMGNCGATGTPYNPDATHVPTLLATGAAVIVMGMFMNSLFSYRGGKREPDAKAAKQPTTRKVHRRDDTSSSNNIYRDARELLGGARD